MPLLYADVFKMAKLFSASAAEVGGGGDGKRLWRRQDSQGRFLPMHHSKKRIPAHMQCKLSLQTHNYKVWLVVAATRFSLVSTLLYALDLRWLGTHTYVLHEGSAKNAHMWLYIHIL